METEVPVMTRERNEKKRRLQNYSSERLEVMKKEDLQLENIPKLKEKWNRM